MLVSVFPFRKVVPGTRSFSLTGFLRVQSQHTAHQMNLPILTRSECTLTYLETLSNSTLLRSFCGRNAYKDRGETSQKTNLISFVNLLLHINNYGYMSILTFDIMPHGVFFG